MIDGVVGPWEAPRTVIAATFAGTCSSPRWPAGGGARPALRGLLLPYPGRGAPECGGA